MQKFTVTRLFKVFLLTAFFVGLFYLNPVKISNPLRNVFLVVLSPFQKIAYTTSVTIAGVGEFVGSIGQLKEENKKLIIENERFLQELAMLVDTKNENEDLRKQLGLLPRDQFELLAANVIGQDPNGMGNWIEIDKGSGDGITEGMPVIISKSALIGRVSEVALKNAKIILLTNPKSVINVATTQAGAKGVARGEYGLGITFDMILQTDSIQGGDDVVTSGIGGGLPRGLYVGTVQNVHSSDDHLFQQATIISPIQISKLQFVFVVMGNRKY